MPRGSRATSTEKRTVRVARSTLETWWVHAELTMAVFSSPLTAIPHASAGSAIRAVSTRPASGSGRRTSRRPGSRTLTRISPSSGNTCAGRPGSGMALVGWSLSKGRGTTWSTLASSSAT